MVSYTLTITDEVNAALEKKAAMDDITPQELLQSQVEYYLGCALYDCMGLNHPINTPGLSIAERLEVYAIGVNEGEKAAHDKVDEILASRF